MILDKSTIQQVLGGLMKNPSFLNQSDKYQLNISDFSSRFEKILFISILNLNSHKQIVIIFYSHSILTLYIENLSTLT